MRNREEWYEFCMDKGTSGDQIFDILRDWKKERDEYDAAHTKLAKRCNQLEHLVGSIADLLRRDITSEATD
jgi:hypothetical protein